MKRFTRKVAEGVLATTSDEKYAEAAKAMLEYFDKVEELIPQIEEAFAGVKLEDGIGLLESDGVDDYAGPQELARLRAMDEKDDWRRIPVERLCSCYAATTFLDAKGMRFHTPAFLVGDLRGETGGLFIDTLLAGSYLATEFPALLTPEQRETIFTALKIYCEGRSQESLKELQEARLRFRA